MVLLYLYQKTKSKVHILLHPELGESKADKFVNIFIISLIVLNVLAVMIETIEPIHLKYKIYFVFYMNWLNGLDHYGEYIQNDEGNNKNIYKLIGF